MLFFFLSKHRISQRESWGKEGSGCCWGAFDNLFCFKSTNWIQLNMQLSTLKAPRNAGVRRKQRTFFQPKYNDHRGRRSGWWLCDRETLCDVYMTRESHYVGAWSNHQLISSCVSKHIQGKIFFMATISCRLIGLFVKKLYGAALMGEWKTHLP